MKNDELHEQVIGALALPADRPCRVLDIGSGTGHGCSLVLEKYPNASVVGVDFSPKMLAKGRAVLGHYVGRVELIETDIVDFRSNSIFDAVISVFTIHNLQSSDKGTWYKATKKIRATMP